MNFATVLKNTILIFMIIIIMYFIIKSKILDSGNTQPVNINPLATQKKTSLDYEVPGRSVRGDDNMKELYDFVFDDSKAETNLNAFFDKPAVNPDCVNDKDKTIDCNVGQFNPTGVKQMCQSPITKHYEELEKKKVRLDGNVDLNTSCINETVAKYESEPVMSGGALLGGVTGFDDFCSDFATL
jgi:hypothetical protein